jgi:hypothetical protein
VARLGAVSSEESDEWAASSRQGPRLRLIRWLVCKLLAVLLVLTSCGFGTYSQNGSPSFFSKATSCRCVTRLDQRATGWAISGIHGTFKEYPASKSFSDARIDADWAVLNRALQAHVSNRTKSAMILDGVVIRCDGERTSIPAAQIAAGSSQSVRIASIADIGPSRCNPRGRRSRSWTNELRLELRVRIAEDECTYSFLLASGAIEQPSVASTNARSIP